MPRKPYKSISLPESIVDRIDAFVEKSDWHDSRPDLIKDALEEYLERHGDDT